MINIKQLISDLGKTEEEIVETLRLKGIKGYRQIHSKCPIANYLKKELRIDYVSVGNCKISTSLNSYYINDSHINNFIKNFDNGEYPFLEANSE
jgi:hypothetical protein